MRKRRCFCSRCLSEKTPPKKHRLNIGLAIGGVFGTTFNLAWLEKSSLLINQALHLELISRVNLSSHETCFYYRSALLKRLQLFIDKIS